MSEKVIGILGGMGPAATVELFNRIVNNTPALVDQDHVEVVVINDPHIPDRTKYILGNGINPVPKMLENLNRLQLVGADIAIIPCMTAHTFIHELQKKSPIPVINAIKLVDRYLQKHHPDIKRIGLLATDGSVKSGVYERYLSQEVIVPEFSEQEKLMNVIYGEQGIKSGNTGEQVVQELKDIVNNMKSKNIQGVIAGCTELSLVMSEDNMDFPVIDPVMLLAKEAVRVGKQQENPKLELTVKKN